MIEDGSDDARRLEVIPLDTSEGQAAGWASTTSEFGLTTYVMRPSERPSIRCVDLVQRPSRFGVQYRCMDGFTVVPNCQIQINHSVAPNSGGHNHNGSRPQGEFVPSSGNTGPTACCFHTVYTAPEVAGVTQVSAVGVDPAGNHYFDAFTIGVLHYDETQFGVQVRLGALPAGENYTVIGSLPQHVENHYGTPGFNAALVTMADRYAARYPGQRLEYNDMSLVGGGVFDLNFNWMPPRHCYHRTGRNMDLQTEQRTGLSGVPEGNRPELRRIAEDEAGLQIDPEEVPPHWHVTLIR